MTVCWGSNLYFVISRSKPTTVVLVLLFYCAVSELQKPSSPGLEPKTVSQDVGFISTISSSKKITLVLAPFSYRA
jgi:ABC-type arginine transport system permease subunit